MAVIASILVGLVILATPASAHHPEITGQSECSDARGQVDIAYTAKTWTTNPPAGEWKYFISESDIPGAPATAPGGVQYKGHVILQYKAAGASPWVEVRNDIEFTPTNNGVVAGSFTIAETVAFPITLRVLDTGNWKIGAVASSNRTVGVAKPYDDCSPDTYAPEASSAWECGDDNIVVTLDNSASTAPVVFDVNGTAVEVAAGDIDTVDLAAPVEDGPTVDVTVKVNGATIHTAPYTASCIPPEVECEDNETPVDTNDDGVNDECEPIVCDDGETATDTGSNDVGDTCEPVVCEDNETPVDTGTNGVDDTCDPSSVKTARRPVTPATNGVDDTCTEVECDAGETASDSGTNGVDDTCEPVVCEDGETAT